MLKSVVLAPVGRIMVAGLGDIQHGNEGADLELVRNHVTFLKETAKRTKSHLIVVGVGDYVDVFSPSNRDAYNNAKIYRSPRKLVSEKVLIPLVEEVAEVLKPIKDNIAFLLHGHHYAPIMTEDSVTDTDKLLADMLGTTLKSTGVVVLEIQQGKDVFRIVCMHGEGGGRTEEYGLRRLRDMLGGWTNIDAIIMGHTHVLSSLAICQIDAVREANQTNRRNIPILNTGSFLRAYVVGKQTYPEDYGMRPRALGGGFLSWSSDETEIQATLRWL